MDIETAANIGEAVSGIAILFTLLFSLRQMAGTKTGAMKSVVILPPT